LDFNGNAIARDVSFTLVRQQNVRFSTTIAQFSRNKRINEFRVFNTVRTNQI